MLVTATEARVIRGRVVAKGFLEAANGGPPLEGCGAVGGRNDGDGVFENGFHIGRIKERGTLRTRFCVDPGSNGCIDLQISNFLSDILAACLGASEAW
jgi:hypothetical protein